MLQRFKLEREGRRRRVDCRAGEDRVSSNLDDRGPSNKTGEALVCLADLVRGGDLKSQRLALHRAGQEATHEEALKTEEEHDGDKRLNKRRRSEQVVGI